MTKYVVRTTGEQDTTVQETVGVLLFFGLCIIIIIINDTLARSLEPVVTECKEHTIHTQTQIVASRKPKEIKHTHEGEANFTT